MKKDKISQIKIEFSPDLSFIAGIRKSIASISCNFGFNSREAYQIETVVDELCNNAIEHGTVITEKPVRLICKFSEKKLELLVKDSGSKRFDSKKVYGRNFDLVCKETAVGAASKPHRGRGLIIVNKLVDKMDISTGRFGTVVKVLKKSSEATV